MSPGLLDQYRMIRVDPFQELPEPVPFLGTNGAEIHLHLTALHHCESARRTVSTGSNPVGATTTHASIAMKISGHGAKVALLPFFPRRPLECAG